MTEGIKTIDIKPAVYGGFKPIAEVAAVYDFPAGVTRHPKIVILQNPNTRAIRIDIYDCEDGLNVTYVNGGVDNDAADNRYQKWLRDLTTNVKSNQKVTVRFMAREGDHLRLKA